MLIAENVDVSEIEESTLLSDSEDIVVVSGDVGSGLISLGLVAKEVEVEIIEKSSLAKVSEVEEGVRVRVVTGDVGEDRDREDVVDRVRGTNGIETGRATNRSVVTTECGRFRGRRGSLLVAD